MNTTLNPLEAVCQNPDCASVITGAGAENPPAPGWSSPHFHHVMLVRGSRAQGPFGAGLPRCPCCGHESRL